MEEKIKDFEKKVLKHFKNFEELKSHRSVNGPDVNGRYNMNFLFKLPEEHVGSFEDNENLEPQLYEKYKINEINEKLAKDIGFKIDDESIESLIFDWSGFYGVEVSLDFFDENVEPLLVPFFKSKIGNCESRIYTERNTQYKYRFEIVNVKGTQLYTNLFKIYITPSGYPSGNEQNLGNKSIDLKYYTNIEDLYRNLRDR